MLLVYNNHKENNKACDTYRRKPWKRKEGKGTMKENGIERDFLQDVREAKPEDCKTIVEALRALDGQKDENGELTSLGFLVCAVVEELTANGIMKMRYGKGVDCNV